MQDDAARWRLQYGTSALVAPKTYFGIRVLLALFWLGVTIASLANWASDTGIGYWFTKLTHWSALLELAYLTVGAYTTGMIVLSPEGTPALTRKNPWFVVCTMVLQNIMMPISFMVFLLYWTLVFSGSYSAISVLTHGVNFAVMIFDALINRQPLSIVQVVLPVSFALFYLVFTLIYWAAGGTYEDGVSPYIYKALNWERPNRVLVLSFFIVLIITPCVYALFVSCFRLEVCCDRAQADVERGQANVVTGSGARAVASKA